MKGSTCHAMPRRLVVEDQRKETRHFMTDAAHELRTPLAVMRNVAEVALRSPREPEHDHRVLGDILEEVEGLSRLAEQLLFLCRARGWDLRSAVPLRRRTAETSGSRARSAGEPG